MNQKGMTLLEQVCGLAVIGIILGSIMPSINLINKMQFESLVSEVHTGIMNVRQMAHLTNRTYTISQGEGFIRMSSGSGSPMEKVYEIPAHVTSFVGDKELQKPFSIQFNADLSPAKGGTVTLMDAKTKQKIQITIRPVTGKVTLYEEKWD